MTEALHGGTETQWTSGEDRSTRPRLTGGRLLIFKSGRPRHGSALGKALTGRRQDAGRISEAATIDELGSDDVRTGRMRRMMSTMLNQDWETRGTDTRRRRWASPTWAVPGPAYSACHSAIDWPVARPMDTPPRTGHDIISSSTFHQFRCRRSAHFADGHPEPRLGTIGLHHVSSVVTKPSGIVPSLGSVAGHPRCSLFTPRSPQPSHVCPTHPAWTIS
jgi:hypothetical protein